MAPDNGNDPESWFTKFVNDLFGLPEYEEESAPPAPVRRRPKGKHGHFEI